jgi:hypothetical protein
VIDAISSLSTVDGGAIGAIYDGGGSVTIDGGDDNILSVGHLNMGNRCSSGGSGALATGK